MIPGYFSRKSNSAQIVRNSACVIFLNFYYSPELFLRQKIWAHATTNSQISGQERNTSDKEKIM